MAGAAYANIEKTLTNIETTHGSTPTKITRVKRGFEGLREFVW